MFLNLLFCEYHIGTLWVSDLDFVFSFGKRLGFSSPWVIVYKPRPKLNVFVLATGLVYKFYKAYIWP